MNPKHKPGFLSNYLHEKGVNVVRSGSMGSSAANIFKKNSIKIICRASESTE